MERKPITLYVQSIRQSLICDTMSIGVTLIVFIPGLIMDSSAMQWLGALMFILYMFSRFATVPGI